MKTTPSFLRSLGASTLALALLGGAALGAQAFVSPTNAPTGAGFTSQGSLISVMSGSLSDVMGTSFSSGSHSLKAIADKIDALPWTASGTTTFYTGAVAVSGSTVSGSLKLDVGGKMGATQYCDENGDNCVTPGTSSGTSPWSISGSDAFRNSGNVGIGTASPATKLEVVGAVKVGYDASSCSSSNAGAIRYNSGSNTMQYCNGTSWN